MSAFHWEREQCQFWQRHWKSKVFIVHWYIFLLFFIFFSSSSYSSFKNSSRFEALIYYCTVFGLFLRLDFLRYIFLSYSLFLSFQRIFVNKSVQVERMCLTPWHFICRLFGLFSISSDLYLKIGHSYRAHTPKKCDSSTKGNSNYGLRHSFSL